MATGPSTSEETKKEKQKSRRNLPHVPCKSKNKKSQNIRTARKTDTFWGVEKLARVEGSQEAKARTWTQKSPGSSVHQLPPLAGKKRKSILTGRNADRRRKKGENRGAGERVKTHSAGKGTYPGPENPKLPKNHRDENQTRDG